MVLKLLPKREVDKAKALDKKREIDEGVKLATRVDQLRELHATEEKNLFEFRNKTLAAIKAELKELTDRREYLKADLAETENRRKEALKPIDDKWLKIREKEEELALLQESLAAKRAELVQLEARLVSHEKELAEEEARIRDERERSKSTLGSAAQAAQEAREHLAQARNEAQAIIVRAELKEKAIAMRELDVTQHEEQLIAQREQLKKDTIALLVREDRLKDRYKELEKISKLYVKPN